MTTSCLYLVLGVLLAQRLGHQTSDLAVMGSIPGQGVYQAT